MTRITNALRNFLSLAVIIGVAFFFYKSFQLNREAMQAHPFNPDYFFLALSFGCVLTTYFLSTCGWRLALNALSADGRISFTQSVAVVNTGNLIKYIPGKVWSYALQMYWLSASGFSKPVVLYVNLVNLFVSLVTSTIVGLVCLAFSGGKFPVWISVSLLAAAVLSDILFIAFNAPFTRGLIGFAGRILNRDIACFSMSRKTVVGLHAIHFAAALSFGVSAFFLCPGIGVDFNQASALPVMSSLLLADVMGFMVVIVPGGLGVREALMYLMLGATVSTASLPLVLPVASRIVGMCVDVFLGTTAFVLLKYKIGPAMNRPATRPACDKQDE